MAIEQGIWRIGDKPIRLKSTSLASEELLEQQISQDLSLLNSDWLLIGRQVRTAFDKRIDLLAIDGDGSVVIIELKRDKTPRDVVAQTLDYASWVVGLSAEEINNIYADFAVHHDIKSQSLDEAFQAKFSVELSNVEVNNTHQLVVVASELDASTERIINYLNDNSDVSINAVFFNVFEDNGNQYISRAWLIDPKETQDKAIAKAAATKEPWNGEFYVSYGGENRSWEDARKFGFISAGYGAWYSRTLSMLTEGDRIWVNIPGSGFVGVAQVIGEKTRLESLSFPEYENKTILQLDVQGNYQELPTLDDNLAEYAVPVRWIYTVSESEAVSETGLFGNQNTVCKPRTSKWVHTVNRLKEVWHVEL